MLNKELIEKILEEQEQFQDKHPEEYIDFEHPEFNTVVEPEVFHVTKRARMDKYSYTRRRNGNPTVQAVLKHYLESLGLDKQSVKYRILLAYASGVSLRTIVSGLDEMGTHVSYYSVSKLVHATFPKRLFNNDNNTPETVF